MPREKPNYRENLKFLHEQYGKMVFSKKETTHILGVSINTLQKMVKEEDIKTDSDGRIPIGSLANYLCG